MRQPKNLFRFQFIFYAILRGVSVDFLQLVFALKVQNNNVIILKFLLNNS